jgi:hypothetical protein
MTSNDLGPETPTAQDLAAFAKEYYRSYMETIDEKKPKPQPKFAQEAPYNIQCYVLPNGCICMIFTQGKELSVSAGSKDWNEVQELIVKGVDHFAAFYPFEGRTLGDWNKRGKRDALRDVRLIDKSEFVKASAELDIMAENVTKMIKANPWLSKSGSEMISTLRSVEGRLRGGFPTVDAIASLQSMKAYSAAPESVKIEFPDRSLLEEISKGVKEVCDIQQKLAQVEDRMIEVEKTASAPALAERASEISDRVDRLEKQLEKVSNILTMINSKVETYFSKTAERDRQSDLEQRIQEYTERALSHESKISKLEKEAESVVEEMRKMAAKLDKDVHESRKRIARMEKHFVEFAKLIQE